MAPYCIRGSNIALGGLFLGDIHESHGLAGGQTRRACLLTGPYTCANHTRQKFTLRAHHRLSLSHQLERGQGEFGVFKISRSMGSRKFLFDLPKANVTGLDRWSEISRDFPTLAWPAYGIQELMPPLETLWIFYPTVASYRLEIRVQNCKTHTHMQCLKDMYYVYVWERYIGVYKAREGYLLAECPGAFFWKPKCSTS